MRKLIRAPFTKAQITYLKLWQENDALHPYNCANRAKETCRTKLEVHKHGLVCPKCGFVQDWAIDYGN